MVVTLPTGKTSQSNESATVSEESDSMSVDMYEEYVEKRLEKVLSSVDGVGKVKVMLSVKNSSEKVLAKTETYPTAAQRTFQERTAVRMLTQKR